VHWLTKTEKSILGVWRRTSERRVAPGKGKSLL
jgi:hypothetical protein